MSLSESEFYEAGLSLPPEVRKQVALRLLDSLKDPSQAPIDTAWAAEIDSRLDDILAGDVRTMSENEVNAHLAKGRAARQTARRQA